MKIKFYIVLVFSVFSLFSCIDVVFDESTEEGLEKTDTLHIKQWDGHVVALGIVDKDRRAKLLMISLAEWEPADESYITYAEGNLSDWHIPTKDEATVLRKLYAGDNCLQLNQTFQELGADTLSTTSRYYCEEKSYTFSFKEGTVISKAGTSAKNYRLRLVKLYECDGSVLSSRNIASH